MQLQGLLRKLHSPRGVALIVALAAVALSVGLVIAAAPAPGAMLSGGLLILPALGIVAASKAPASAFNLEDIRARLHVALERVDRGIDAERAQTHEQIAAAQARRASVESRVEEKRQERQRRLAAGEDVAALNRGIREIREEVELAEDLIAGLEDKLRALEAENRTLVTETIPALYREMARLLIPPIAARWNRKAAELAEISKELVRAIADSRQEFSERSGSFVHVSSWEGFAQIPLLYLPGELERKPEDAFHYHCFMEAEKRRLQQLSGAGDGTQA